MGQDDISNLFGSLEKGDDESIKKFILTYLRRGAEIIVHDHSYIDFQDKIPDPKVISQYALYNFAKNFKSFNFKSIDNKEFWRKLRDAFLIQLRCLIHEQIRQVCLDVYTKVPDAENRLMNYETNVLLTIERMSREFRYSDHVRVASKVMEELMEHVKKNGITDSKGKEIRNFFYFIRRIIKCRLIDQIRREQKMNQFPDGFENGKPTEVFIQGNEAGCDDIDKQVYRRELQNIFYNRIINLETLERFIIINHYYEDRSTHDIIKEIYIIFGKKMTPSSYCRIKQKALKKLSISLDLQA